MAGHGRSSISRRLMSKSSTPTLVASDRIVVMTSSSRLGPPNSRSGASAGSIFPRVGWPLVVGPFAPSDGVGSQDLLGVALRLGDSVGWP